MAKNRKGLLKTRQRSGNKPRPRRGAEEGSASISLAREGIKTSRDFKQLSAALMCDTVLGRIGPQTTNAACNAGGKLLKVVEMEHRFGKRLGGDKIPTLSLSG